MDDNDNTVLLIRSGAIDEYYIQFLFVLISPLEYFLQVPELLVLRLLLQQTVNISLKVVSLDKNMMPIVNFYNNFVVAIWIFYQFIRNQNILHSAQIAAL
jgi:hypothetical protein